MDSLNWQPVATRETLVERARILNAIRAFFHSRGLLEVETPILSTASIPDPHIESFYTRSTDVKRYLQTSPEFAMKRLLASGYGAIFQICKVFRQGERGKRHNPEFTMLEWYHPGYSYQQLMQELDALFHEIVNRYQRIGTTQFLSYQQAFINHVSIDPLTASIEDLKDAATNHGITISLDLNRHQWLDLLMTHLVEPNLGMGHATFITDYPADQAALARINPDNPDVAERFELYFQGIELANGFGELVDATEQRRRFNAENDQRKSLGLNEIPLDENLLSALSSGMPESSGVAVGLDRLIMVTLGKKSIDEVMSFTYDNA